MTPEGRIQAYAMVEFKKLGGLVRKIRYEGRNGCPDLLVILPGGLVVFVEVKKDERTGPDPHQVREHKRMRQRGAIVRTIGSKEQVNELVAEWRYSV
jgi:hypothetical protein